MKIQNYFTPRGWCMVVGIVGGICLLFINPYAAIVFVVTAVILAAT